MDKQIDAIILAGGFGTRLNGVINNPKGLIPYKDTTLVGRLLSEVLTLPQIRSITLVTNHLYYQAYSDYLTSHFDKQPIKLINDGASENSSRLGAIGDLMLALEQSPEPHIDTLVLPSDTFYNFPLSQFLDFYGTHGNFSTVVRSMDSKEIAGRLGCAVMEGDRITQFVEKPEEPPSPYAAIPFYVYPPQILVMLNRYKELGNSLDAPGSIIPWLIDQGLPVRGLKITSATIDVGTPVDLDRLALG